MSSINIKFKKDFLSLVDKNYLEINKKISEFTAGLFNKKEDEIIVEVEEFQKYDGKLDILIRAETSRKNINLLEQWSNGLKDIVTNSNFQNLKVGIKTYVTDSFWQEFEVK